MTQQDEREILYEIFGGLSEGSALIDLSGADISDLPREFVSACQWAQDPQDDAPILDEVAQILSESAALSAPIPEDVLNLIRELNSVVDLLNPPSEDLIGVCLGLTEQHDDLLDLATSRETTAKVIDELAEILNERAVATRQEEEVTYRESSVELRFKLLAELKIGEVVASKSAARKAILNLGAVEKLDLSQNRLVRVPAGVFTALRQLKQLDLSENAIKVLPSSVEDLDLIDRVNLSYNPISRIPPGLLNRPSLRSLLAVGCSLVGLPELQPESGIRRLSVARNRISSVAKFVSSGERLSFLDASENQIEEFDLGQAHSELQNLNLRSNQITTFDLAALDNSKIETLDLSNNMLTSLTGDIEDNSSLVTLNISHNLLTSIPPAFARLRALYEFDMEENPLPDTLRRARDAGLKSLQEYLLSIEGGETQACADVKLVFVGDGNIGKTSIVRRLSDDEFEVDRAWTHGLEISTMQLPNPASPDISLKIWDFGGQLVFRLTHQFFISQDAIYVVVWRTRGGFDGGARYWLKSIQQVVGDKARVLLVSTFADDDPPSNLDLERIQHDFYPLVADYVPVDSKSASGMPQLNDLFAALAPKMSHWGDPIANSWLDVREKLRELEEPFIQLDFYLQICDDHGLSVESAMAWARLMHVIGDVIFFDGDIVLGSVVVLDPEILAQAVAALISSESIVHNKGLVEHREIAKTWSAYRAEFRPAIFPFLLALMERYDVSYQLANGDSSLVVPLVPEVRPLDLPFEPEDPTSSTTHSQLSLSFEFDADPKVLIAWLTVRSRRWATKWSWREGVVLEQTELGSQALVEANPDGLTISVRGPHPSEMFSALRNEVEWLLTERMPHVASESFVPCKQGQQDNHSCRGRFRRGALEAATLEGVSTLQCSECLEQVTIAGLLAGIQSATSSVDETHAAVLERLRSIELTFDRFTKVGLANYADFRMLMLTSLEQISLVSQNTPRLCSIEPLSDNGKFWKRRYGLRYWCEHPDEWHDNGELIPFERPQEWFTTSAPLIRKLGLLVRSAAKVTGADPAIGDGMISLARQADSSLSPDSVQQMEILDGVELRAFRKLLTEIDPSPSKFGDLVQVLGEGGRPLWVCPIHRRKYQQGLPKQMG